MIPLEQMLQNIQSGKYGTEAPNWSSGDVEGEFRSDLFGAYGWISGDPRKYIHLVNAYNTAYSLHKRDDWEQLLREFDRIVNQSTASIPNWATVLGATVENDANDYYAKHKEEIDGQIASQSTPIVRPTEDTGFHTPWHWTPSNWKWWLTEGRFTSK